MNAKKLLSSLFPEALIPDVEVEAVTESSQKADSHTLFVCIRGARADGHRYAADAYARGCRLFVAEQILDLPDDATVLQTENTRLALAKLACSFYGNPADKLHVIGITGTKGKTTTACMITHLLNRAKIPCGYIGTNGIHYQTVHTETKNTTPDPLTLQKTLFDMHRAGIKAVVLEVSSQALAQERVQGITFEAVLFTNLYPDHIGVNEHADLNAYKACKRRLFTDFESHCRVIWSDDPSACEIVPENGAVRKITCSAKDPHAELYVHGVCPTAQKQSFGISFDLWMDQRCIPVHLPLPGGFNAHNAAMALAVACRVFGIDPHFAANELANTEIDGRAKQVELPNGAKVLIDYAHNGVGLEKLLTALRQYAPKRLIVLFGSVGERTQLRRMELGTAAARYADLAILTSDNPGHESPDAIIAQIAQAFEGASTPYVCISDRKEAIEYALAQLTNGDVLVLAGKGHEHYQLVGTRKLPFSELAIVQDFIQKQTKKEVSLS